MKNKDISRAIGNIDLKYVDEAHNYTAKRANLTKFIALAACLAIIVAAIPAVLVLNRENVDDTLIVTTTDTNKITKPTEYKIIYCSSEDAQDFKEALKDKYVEIREDAESNFDFSAKVGDFDSGYEIPARLYINFRGEQYSFTFQETEETQLINSSDEYLKSLGYLAFYYMDNNPMPQFGELLLMYNYVTNQVVSVDFSYYPGFDTNPELTEKEIGNIANDDLDELFGEGFSSQYTLEKIVKSNDNKYGSRYLVDYRRYISGYPTNEVVLLDYNLNGELLRVSSQNLNSFKNLLNKLDAESITTADSEATKLLEGKNIAKKYLSVGLDGKVYVTIKYRYPGDKYSTLKLHYEVS